jgi:hypothetical protein
MNADASDRKSGAFLFTKMIATETQSSQSQCRGKLFPLGVLSAFVAE